jgi:ankyrin repeat protein
MDVYKATLNNNIELIERLIKNNANLDIHDSNGFTALMLASYRDQDDIAFKLIESGADLDKKCNLGYTSLIIASIRNNKNISLKLIEFGANLDKKSYDGKTALIWTSWLNFKEIAFKLIEFGADLDRQDDNGKTAFAYATGEIANRLKCAKEFIQALEDRYNRKFRYIKKNVPKAKTLLLIGQVYKKKDRIGINYVLQNIIVPNLFI